MTSLDRPHTTSYQSAIVSIGLSCTLFPVTWCWRISLPWKL